MCSRILTCGVDTFVKIFDVDNPAAEPRTINYHQSPVTALAIKKNGKNIVTGTESHFVQYFSYPTCEFDKNITRTQSPVQAVVFDHKGKFIAVGGDDGIIRMCIASATNSYTVLKGHTDSILSLAFDPLGDYLASSSADGTVIIWDITDEAIAVKSLPIVSKVAPGSSQRLRLAWQPAGERTEQRRGQRPAQEGAARIRQTGQRAQEVGDRLENLLGRVQRDFEQRDGR